MTKSEPHYPLRQWRVTITEDRESRAWFVMLAWRTFPCRADHWDDHRSYTVPTHARAPITSLDALRALLGEISEGDWEQGNRPRY